MIYSFHMGCHKRPENKCILLCIGLAHGGWRDFLAGFLESSRSRREWNLRIVDPLEFTPERVEELRDKGIKGIVAGNISDASAQALNSSDIPLVLVGNQASALAKRAVNITLVHHDDLSIGKSARTELEKLRKFNCWAFLPAEGNPYWSELRQQGFARTRNGDQMPMSIFRCPFKRGTEGYEKRLGIWVEALPKPAAIMTACDLYAVDLLDACKSRNVDVPRQVSVIGVDNDVLLCETLSPTLSSIAPNHIEEGRLAAIALAKLLARHRSVPRTVHCTKKIVVMRESTSSATPAAALINRALEFVKTHAAENINVSDVVAYLRVSRSLVELRFRQFHGKSLAKSILEARLQEVRKRLMRSTATFTSIATACGWKNPNVLKNAFRRHFGMSMREMRKTAEK